eukprot:TRINITY_DN11031_c0_g1_i1.p1 TRINITY_DN11031_c0_g1~~TRINITY_DN11031_c0_g1_i1.p1  ORF type:complete len:148 (+),score=13.18 TRINITY_DN11031_c0_g1_i1:52-495(+)
MPNWIGFVSIIAYIVIAYFPHVILVLANKKAGITRDNVHPRTQQNSVLDTEPDKNVLLAARAKACHENHIENFPFFAVSVLSNYIVGKPVLASICGIITVVLRIFYTVFYIKGTNEKIAGLRSIVWGLGLINCIVFTSLAAANMPTL